MGRNNNNNKDPIFFFDKGITFCLNWLNLRLCVNPEIVRAVSMYVSVNV